MTEAARGFLAHVFARAPHDRIVSGAFVGNDASLRVQEKLGFKRCGETMVHARPHAAELQHIDTVLDRRRFEEVVAAGISAAKCDNSSV